LLGICARGFPRYRDLSVSANAKDGAEALQKITGLAIMFLIRVAFWVGLAIQLLPSDERQQQQLIASAVATVERAATFCDRHEKACEAGSELWATFLKKAEFGARMAISVAGAGSRMPDDAAPLPPASVRGAPARVSPTALQGTLTPADLTPAWRGQAQRTGT
jgi:hypothetical protein